MNDLIEHVKKQLEYRAKMAGLYNPHTTQTAHFKHDNFIYVICNVIITDYDADLRPYQRYNVTQLHGDATFNNDEDGRLIMTIQSKLLPIYLPDLIARIDIITKEIIYGDNHNPLDGSLSQLV